MSCGGGVSGNKYPSTKCFESRLVIMLGRMDSTKRFNISHVHGEPFPHMID